MNNMSRNKIIIIICIVLAMCSFLLYFFTRTKYDNPINKKNSIEKEEFVGDISFTYVDKSVYIKDAIPTLDKFGVMNEAFSFTIKNNSSSNKTYTLSLVDDNSTIKNSDIRYELTKNNIVLGINTLSEDGNIDVGSLLGNEEVKYSIKLWLNYNSEYVVGTFRKKIAVFEGEKETVVVNEPMLAEGMIPVYYDENNNGWYKADNKNTYNSEWYDYADGKWANVVTIKNDKRKFYEESSVGTKILLEDINSMWVWIPRFNYTLNNNDIIINFVKENEEAYSAFNFNKQELPGFWISKYEAGIDENSSCIKTTLSKNCNNTNNKLYFIPNYLFMNRITMANLFYTIRKMELNGNIYGFKGAGNKLNNDGTIKGDINNMDVHMIKNSEWQAVALLSDSKYGKSGNNNFKDEEKIIYNNNSIYTGKSFYQDKLYDYNIKLTGEGASTTGNVTGVYDMAGGKREYVMINNDKLDIFNKKSNSGFTSIVKEYYYDNDFLSDTTLQLQDRISKDNSITNNPITRGGYKNTGNIFNVYSASDFINKISLESNSRASLVIIKEKENDKA